MARRDADKKGPVVVVSAHRRRAARLAELLEAERFEVLSAAGPAELDELEASRSPTVVVIDWPEDSEPARRDLIRRPRARRTGARIVVVADGAEAEALAASTAVRGVIGPALDPEEVADVVWRTHQEVVDALALAPTPAPTPTPTDDR